MTEKKYIGLNDAIDALYYFNGKSPTGRTAQEIIKSIPAADVRPVVRGKWQVYYTDLDSTYTRCTACLCIFKGAKNHYNFCPNCGADMREEN